MPAWRRIGSSTDGRFSHLSRFRGPRVQTVLKPFPLTAPPGRRGGARGVAANGMVGHDPEASSGAVWTTASLCRGISYERSSAGVHRRQTSTTGLVFGESGGRSAGSDGSRRVCWLRMIMPVSDTASAWRCEPRGAAWRTQSSHIGPAVW